MAILWCVLGAALVIVEVLNPALIAVFVAVGSFAAAIAALAGAPVAAQAVVLAAVSLGSLLAARPPLVALTRRHQHVALPGVGSLLGQSALTVDVVGDEHHPGHVLLAGERWLAVTEAGRPLPPNVPVMVAAVRGTTLVVWPTEAQQGGAVP